MTDRRHIPTSAGGNHVTAQQQLQAAITASGLSAQAYARTILTRDPRTVRRWLSGDSPIPEAVREFLEGLVKPQP